MISLTDRELLVIDRIKTFSKKAPSRDRLVRDVFTLLKTLIPFNSAAFFYVNPASLDFTGAYLDNLDGDFLSLYFQKFHKSENIVLSIREFLKKGYDSKRSSEMITLKSYTSSHFYKEFLSKFNCHYFLATCFVVDQKCFGYLILWRTKAERDFLKRHSEIMRIVAPYISQSLKNCQPNKSVIPDQTVSEEEKLLEIINKRSSPGVLILDHNSRILHKNDAAQTVLYLLSKTWIQPSSSKNEPHISLPVEILKLCDKLRAASAANPTGNTDQIACAISIVSFGSEIYSLRALLLDKDTEPDRSSSIMVLIESISTTQRFDLEKARNRYQLTFKEKEVVELLFNGFTNKEVAKELCIGVYTLKDHMRSIRQKMGTCTRTGILSKVLQY